MSDEIKPNSASEVAQLTALQNERIALLTQMYNWENQLATSHPNQTPVAHRNSIINNLTTARNQLIEIQRKIDKIQISPHEYVLKNKEILEQTDIAIKAAEEAKKRAIDALETVSKAAGISAAMPFIFNFKTRDKELEKPFYWWLGLSIGFLITSIIFIIFQKKILDEPTFSANPGTAEIAVYISNKVIIIALLVGAMAWCSKIFLDVYKKKDFYRHKIVVAKTFQTFMESTTNQSTEDIILKVAVRNLFSSPPSSKESSETEMEILKNITETTKNLTTTE